MSGECVELMAHSGDWVQDICHRVQDRAANRSCNFLVLGDKVLEFSSTLAESNVKDGATLKLIRVPAAPVLLTTWMCAAKLCSFETGACIQSL